MKKILLLALMIGLGIAAIAQSPTIVSPSTNCVVVHNFNTSNEGFSSPSIYSDGNDVAFSWNAAAGAELETTGFPVRNASLISPVYVQNSQGSATIGFRYAVPAGTEYRIRVISAVVGAPIEVLATTANGPVYTPLPAGSGNVCLLLADQDLSIGRLIRFEFTFRLTNPGDALFDDLAIEIAAGPLPVTFEGFVARKNAEGYLKLLWDVGQEQNVAGYYVESSTNGTNFTNAGYVTAAGKSVYSFDYPDKPVQTMFFRVRNIDLDGKSKYAPVIRVYVKDQPDAHIQIYPVPATNLVTIQHSLASEHSIITLFSQQGKVLQQVAVLSNTFQTQLNISNLESGVYIVRFDDGKANVQSMKMIKN